MSDLYSQLELKPAADEEAITSMLDRIGMRLPEDYLDFLRESNGCIGKGPDLFVILDPVDKVQAFTVGYGAEKRINGLVVIGGDGLGNVLGIDARTQDPKKMHYVLVDSTWLDPDSESCQYRSTTFDGILSRAAGCENEQGGQ